MADLSDLRGDLEEARERSDEVTGDLEEKNLDYDNLEAQIELLEQEKAELELSVKDLEDEIKKLEETEPRRFSVLTAKAKCYSIIRDEHEKLRFTEDDFEILVIVGDKVYGCDDFFPTKDSDLIYTGDI